MSNLDEHQPRICARLCVLMVVAASFTGELVARQCGPCEPLTCQSKCVVTCEDELRDALDCLAADAGCTEIVIPAGCTLDVTSQVLLTTDHSGTPSVPTTFSIKGTIRYTGQPFISNSLFSLTNGTHDIVFDGGDPGPYGVRGTITSIYDAELHDDEPEAEEGGIAKAFRLGETSDSIVIQDLDVDNLTSVMEVEGSGGASGLTVINVHGRDLVRYGFYVSDRADALFENCSINRVLNEHAMRINAGGGVRIESCWSYDSGINAPVPTSGVWVPTGDDVIIDRFSSNSPIRIGPDHRDPSLLARLYNVFARDLRATDSSGCCTTNHVRIEMGVIGGCFLSLCTPKLIVGRFAEDLIEMDRPLEHVHWDHVSGTVVIEANSNYKADVDPVDYDYCFADIDRSGMVDVDDLVAVITDWGPCPTDGVMEPSPPCAADIAPQICGNQAVDVNDLVQVIVSWGGCPSTPVCGDIPASAGGPPQSPPQSVDDCWDRCDYAYPQGGDPWADCFEACLEALEELE